MGTETFANYQETENYQHKTFSSQAPDRRRLKTPTAPGRAGLNTAARPSTRRPRGAAAGRPETRTRVGSAAQQFHLALYARSRRDRGDEGDGESNSAADEHTGGAGLESEAAEARAARRDVGVAGAVRRSPCPGLRSRGRSRVDSLAPSGTPRGRNYYCHCWQRKALRAGTSLGVSSQGHRLRQRAAPPPSSAHGLGSHHVSPALEASKTRKISPFFLKNGFIYATFRPELASVLCCRRNSELVFRSQVWAVRHHHWGHRARVSGVRAGSPVLEDGGAGPGLRPP